MKKILTINNEYLKSSYFKMLDSMHEYIISSKYGVRIPIKPKKISLIDYRTFNFFSMYNTEIYKIYKEISLQIKEKCIEKNINFERNYFYLLGNILDNEKIQKDVSLRMAPNFKVEFCGIYIISSNLDKINIDGKDIDLAPGLMLLLDPEEKVTFNKMSKELTVLYFNVSPLEYLHRQYYQKWIPLI